MGDYSRFKLTHYRFDARPPSPDSMPDRQAREKSTMETSAIRSRTDETRRKGIFSTASKILANRENADTCGSFQRDGPGYGRTATPVLRARSPQSLRQDTGQS